MCVLGVEKDAAVNISHMLPTFQSLACFVTHCQRVLHVVLQQLSAINNTPKSNTTLISALDVHFQVLVIFNLPYYKYIETLMI